MSAVAYPSVTPATPAPKRGLPPRARLYWGAIAGSALLAALAAATHAAPTREEWLTFLPLVLAAGIAHLFATEIRGHQGFHTGMVFTVAGVLLLPPQLVLLVCVLPHFVDWIRQRYPWYIQTFNICNYALSALGGYGAATLAASLLDQPSPNARVGIVAALAFIALNHALLAPMLMLARGQTLRETNLFTVDGAIPDLVLALLGAGAAMALSSDAWALPIVVAPLVLIHRALEVPELLAQTRTDAKTGLFNWRHFSARLEEEVTRARRFSRPVSLLVADLDLLREINNRHGHLAGDAVLLGIADVLRDELRPYDVAARFGGEEFAILLPETSAELAHTIAERIRRAVAAAEYRARDGESPIRASVSIGLASFPEHALDARGLVERADAALYEAKGRGRDRVAAAGLGPTDA